MLHRVQKRLCCILVKLIKRLLDFVESAFGVLESLLLILDPLLLFVCLFFSLLRKLFFRFNSSVHRLSNLKRKLVKLLLRLESTLRSNPIQLILGINSSITLTDGPRADCVQELLELLTSGPSLNEFANILESAPGLGFHTGKD